MASVSKSDLVSYAHVPNSVLAQWEKSHDGLALKKSRRPGPLPDYKDFGHWCPKKMCKSISLNDRNTVDQMCGLYVGPCLWQPTWQAKAADRHFDSRWMDRWTLKHTGGEFCFKLETQHSLYEITLNEF